MKTKRGKGAKKSKTYVDVLYDSPKGNMYPAEGDNVDGLLSGGLSKGSTFQAEKEAFDNFNESVNNAFVLRRERSAGMPK